jgi:argininosuccinate lyase
MYMQSNLIFAKLNNSTDMMHKQNNKEDVKQKEHIEYDKWKQLKVHVRWREKDGLIKESEAHQIRHSLQRV